MLKLSNFFSISLENFVNKIFDQTQYGSLLVYFPSGQLKIYKGNKEGVNADIKFNNFLVVSKFLKKGPVGFAESYMDEDFTTTNLKNLLIFTEINKSCYLDFQKGNWFYRFVSKAGHYLNQNTISKSKKNISYHYDLGNRFYELWLDESMTYSSGFFELNSDNLLNAQINKYKKIIEPMNLNENSKILEIGCGWGGFSSYVAKKFGSKIDAITISKEQFEYTLKKIYKEGLNEKVKVYLQDYRDINNKYDKIVSIEMFEAVGIKYWPVYFRKIKNSLKDNGIAALQIITINEKKRKYYQNNPDFIQQYIFPGGVLPSKKQLYQLTENLGFKLFEINSFGKSYANTLNLWNEQFQNEWNQIAEQGYSKRFKRMWEYYLSYCEAGFLTKATDVSHFLLK
tara:strand:+ start:7549 stop:8739 length:1191 start_codon:yes stop_codon:yes gene_type:complete